tara:strand:- start:1173 stop:2126 length:954 start_codon:yes stop_codon:yes gene_type:complete
VKVVVTSLFGDGFEQSLKKEFPDLDLVFVSSEEDQAREIKDANVFMGAPSRDVFIQADHLQWLHCPGTGIDTLTPITELVDSDVVLTNARGPHTAPMADHVFSMCLAFAHRTNEMMVDQKAHSWDADKYSPTFIEMEDSTMGILALGGIGMAVARRATGFGMDVYAVDKNPIAPPPGVIDVWGLDRLDDLMEISDWLVVTAPYTNDTRGMIGTEQLALMKPSSHMIIISRGGIVDEDALFDTLKNNRISGAGIDAFETEPLPENSPWWDLENVIISPHMSAVSKRMYEGRRDVFRENLRRFISNQPFIYVCDKSSGF